MIRHRYASRDEYEAIQRARTEAKWTFNGVTREEVQWYAETAFSQLEREQRDASGWKTLVSVPTPILCLGVRNGLEVDLFRDIFGGEVQGVELHPQGARPDVWVGSFDAMPAEWAGRFALLYSNALDHAYDPAETAREWRRVAQPGALLALSYEVGAESSATDPIGDIELSDLREWFGGHLVEATLRDKVWLLWRLPT